MTGDGPLPDVLVDELAGRGATAARGDVPGDTGLVVMTDLVAGAPGRGADIPAFYERLRPLLVGTTHDVVVVSPLGGGLGIDPPAPVRPGEPVPDAAGVRGLVKTAALEFPDRRIRLVDVDPAAPVADLARLLADEVAQPEAPVEIGWRGGVRRTPHAVARPTPAEADEGAPALTADSVVLLTGGARGITAEVAVALGRAHGCRLELLGRSPLPEGDEDPALAACADKAALRGALARAGWREPKAIDAEADRLLAAREVRATLAALADAGAPVRYHPVDVRDAEALSGVVTEIYEHHGRLDGVVHGAGALDDHLIADKSPDAFARVFATKVGAAGTLLGSVRAATADGGWAPPAFVVFFGSIAGVCGNRGQADYAAANDALDAMAAANRDVASRVVALDWGPWSPSAGMVSDALARLFQESGMGLIELADGTAVVLDEIGAGSGDGVSQVVVARCSPELMAASLGHGRAGLAASGAAPGDALTGRAGPRPPCCGRWQPPTWWNPPSCAGEPAGWLRSATGRRLPPGRRWPRRSSPGRAFASPRAPTRWPEPFSRSRGLRSIDLVPADLPADAAIALLRRVDVDRLASEWLHAPGGAHHAVALAPALAFLGPGAAVGTDTAAGARHGRAPGRAGRRCPGAGAAHGARPAPRGAGGRGSGDRPSVGVARGCGRAVADG